MVSFFVKLSVEIAGLPKKAITPGARAWWILDPIDTDYQSAGRWNIHVKQID